MKPILFDKNETQFTTYGYGKIDAISAEVTRERNGQYYLYMECPHDGELSHLLVEGMQIKADAGARTKNQTFEITRVVKESGKKISVWANHISQRLMYIPLKPVVGISHVNGEQALYAWKQNMITDEIFDVWSDVTTVGATKWTIDKVSNAREALGGVEGSILDVWGGEYEFDNRTIKLHKEMGREAPIVLEYGRNITSLEEEQRLDTAFTSVYPYAVYTPRDSEGKMMEQAIMTCRIIHSEFMGKEELPRILPINLSDKFENDEVPTVEKLERLGLAYIEANNIGRPKHNMKISYVDLSSTLDYKEMAKFEEIELCDRVPIYFPKYDINDSKAKVVVITYDVLREANKSVELGVIGQSYGNSMTSGLQGQIDSLLKRQEKIEDQVPYVLNSIGNRIWVVDPPKDYEHKVGDVWFKKNGIYSIMYIWDGNDWIEEINTEDLEVVKREFEKVEKQVNSQNESIRQSEEKAAQAIAEATGAKDLAERGEQLTQQLKNLINSQDQEIKRLAERNTIEDEVQAEFISNDAMIRYNENRWDGSTDGYLAKGDNCIPVKHNGDGFLIGKEYTVSIVLYPQEEAEVTPATLYIGAYVDTEIEQEVR